MANNGNKNEMFDWENDFTEEEEAVFEPSSTNKEKYHFDIEMGIGSPGEDEETMEELVARKYKLGMNVTDIRRDHGVSAGTIYRILHRNNIPLRNGKESKYSSMSAEDKELLVEDYLEGMSMKDIYNKYNITKHGAYTIIDEFQAPRRNESKAWEDNRLSEVEDYVMEREDEATNAKEEEVEEIEDIVTLQEDENGQWYLEFSDEVTPNELEELWEANGYGNIKSADDEDTKKTININVPNELKHINITLDLD